MENKITWLHFTDLHYGLKGQNILWPKIKKELFKDLEIIKEELGKIDIVFFSGDLTQSGKKEEFDELTALLKELWSHFKKLGSEPYLVAIPGNHDLNRPDQTKAVVKVLKDYQADKELQENFWTGIKEKNENYVLICECFKNFKEWYESLDLPKPDLNFGLIPGDISTEISINSLKLKIVGLNTAFLELSDDDYFKKLIINPAQIIALTSNNPLEWVEQADLGLLMTHHDPSWYDALSTEYYENDINPGNTFYSHLCGHLHKANTFESAIVGSELRKIQLAPSLFGLQKLKNGTDRIHGYYAGSYLVNDNNIHEQFCPRIAQKRYDGSYGIVPDNGFKLNERNCIEFDSINKNTSKGKNESGTNGNLQHETKIDNLTTTIKEENILDLNSVTEHSKELNEIPRFDFIPLPQHSYVRLIEQQHFIDYLNEDHFAWLITDWGLNEAGFIGSIIDQFKLQTPRSGFSLNCEDIINETELLSAFNEQFGMPLQRFCNIASPLNNTLLVLDHVNTTLYSTASSSDRFMGIIKSITDFCPRLHIIIISRQVPKYISENKHVKLSPLDGAEIRSYLKQFSGTFSELDSTENIVKLLEITSGLPKHIDRIVENLKVVSFQDLIEAEREALIDNVSADQIPKSLKQAISSLDDSNDRVKQRSFRLLKILTVLSNGETAGNLRKFDGTKPINIENANVLEQLSLIEVITTNKILTKVAGNVLEQVKLLRVPRQIRDYVNTLITEDERDTILKLGCDMYFGSQWRSGVIKDIHSSLFGASKFLNVDNCQIITKNLMANAIKNEDTFEIERAANLAINFCEYIYAHDDYKNAVNISEEIYNRLKPTTFNRLKAINAKLYGASLRMEGNDEKSILILNEALEIDEANFSNIEKNSILFNLAYNYLKQKKVDKVIECCKIIEKTVTPKGSDYVQSKFIHAQATLTGSDLLQKLKTLEHNAKKANAVQLANTISLEISKLENDSSQNEIRYSKILGSKDDDYNKIRAIIDKSLRLFENGKTISDDDLVFLNISYSYLYTQRLEGLFIKCHKALWIYCITEKRIEDLLNLFKHSSLIWRISGETELEKLYFMEIKDETEDQIESLRTNSKNSANIDYYVRRELEFNRI